MRIGIDIGGSHIGIGIIENDKVIRKDEHNFNDEEKENVKEVIRNIIHTKFDEFDKNIGLDSIEMVGISVPGKPENGYIKCSPNLKANDLNIKNIVKEKINKPIFVQNDGMCAGLAEREYGSLKGCNNGVYLGLGTGVGMATFINGNLQEEIREAGHMIIEKDGKRCNCGKKGCLEAYASMKALKTKLRARLENNNLTSRELQTIMQTREGIAKTKDVLKEYAEYLAIGISNISLLCSADVIALGGSFVYFKDILFPILQEELKITMSEEEKKMTEIRIAKFANDAGIIGATLLK